MRPRKVNEQEVDPAAPISGAAAFDEKIDVKEDTESVKSHTEIESDPFVPFPIDPDVPEETHRQILTVRAVMVGCILGGFVNASNVYLGLKTGWMFSANLFGAIFGFAILKFFSKTFGENFPILGGSFGPKENAIVQTAATAAGGLGGIFVSAIPAMYQMNLMDDPVKDFPRLLTLTIVSAYYGLLFATPLRKFFIVHVARELKLIFPTATATAMTIRSMHTKIGSANENSKKRTRALAITFAFCIAFRVGASYAPGILWDWHIFTWFYQWSGYSNMALAIESWGWIFEWTPAFIGSGMLVGLNPAISFFGGGVLAWGIIGPALVHTGMAFGYAYYAPGDPEYEKWGGLVTFNSFHLPDPKNHPSPRYWMLWPGVMVMICTSFAELGVQYRLIGFALKSVWKALAMGLNAVGTKIGRPSKFLERQQQFSQKDEHIVMDPAAPEDQVQLFQWGPPLIIVIIATCVVLGLQYHLNVGLSILAIVLGFIFAFLAIQCTGATDTTPATAAAKASQLILGAATKGHAIPDAQRMNLIGGAVATGAAGQSTDLTVDFRVGFLLRTPPKLQWYAQVVGSIVSMFLSPGMFILYMKAYPCVLDVNATTCSFQVPSVAAWRAVAIAVTDPTFPVPNSSGIFAIVLGIFSIAVVLFRHNYLIGHREKYRLYVPNFMAIGLAFVLPSTQYGTAMMTGSIVAYIWAKKNPVSFDTFCYAVAAGMIAGEGMGGVINAILEIAGIGSSKYGSAVGCPGDSFCG
ncbi:OPT oligopeptide transporter protein-domain-containing protein [Sphaerosporella brunnea]|uniref:OPT oligopeptide transporter protein-domain-containing protein n=1 Tax=Sphaerosporella brunnea TaxID=1250544 RepID=A0A5J5FAS2_9PEZI|nr:OPT oligopeptide transporter protein-domain-containing protein [Sphaerosporella brunnea]